MPSPKRRAVGTNPLVTLAFGVPQISILPLYPGADLRARDRPATGSIARVTLLAAESRGSAGVASATSSCPG